jgi:hypothetical protein
LGTFILFIVGVSLNTLNVLESTNVDAGPRKHGAIFSSTKPHKGVVPTTEELTQHFTMCIGVAHVVHQNFSAHTDLKIGKKQYTNKNRNKIDRSMKTLICNVSGTKIKKKITSNKVVVKNIYTTRIDYAH